jgi:hypothetical protein
MTGESEIVEALPKAFWMALLLTGSIEAAEAAVLDGIAALELDHISAGSLLLAAAKSAIQRRTEFPESRVHSTRLCESCTSPCGVDTWLLMRFLDKHRVADAGKTSIA